MKRLSKHDRLYLAAEISAVLCHHAQGSDNATPRPAFLAEVATTLVLIFLTQPSAYKGTSLHAMAARVGRLIQIHGELYRPNDLLDLAWDDLREEKRP